MTEVNATTIRHAAMDLLARREHTHLELVRKLSRRFADYPEMIEEEVDRLREEGLQSDERLAEAFIRARANRGQGPVKIRMELKGKGVRDELISLAFETCEVDWFDLASTVAEKKFGSLEFDDLKDKARLSRFMQQRGFSHDHVTSLC